MTLPNTLNFYTHTQLNTYTHATLEGTVHFSVVVTVTGSRDRISAVATVNSAVITFNSTSAIDKWECRATLSGSPSGVGTGILVASGNAIASGVETQFTVTNNVLTLGDGTYRLSVYVQLDNIWYGG